MREFNISERAVLEVSVGLYVCIISVCVCVNYISATVVGL